MSKIPHGEPYAGKLHVRFDEGADVPCGGVSPYSTPFAYDLVVAAGGHAEHEVARLAGRHVGHDDGGLTSFHGE